MIIAVRVPLSLGSVNNILAGYGSIKGIPNEQNIDMGLNGWGLLISVPMWHKTCVAGGLDDVLQISVSSEAVSHGRAGLLLQILRYGEQSWWLALGMSDIWRPLKAFVSCTLHLWEIRSVTLKWKSLHSGMTRDTTWPPVSQWDWRLTEWSFWEGGSHEALRRERGNRTVRRRKIFFRGSKQISHPSGPFYESGAFSILSYFEFIVIK